jgi:hypothetical protein
LCQGCCLGQEQCNGKQAKKFFMDYCHRSLFLAAESMPNNKTGCAKAAYVINAEHLLTDTQSSHGVGWPIAP